MNLLDDEGSKRLIKKLSQPLVIILTIVALFAGFHITHATAEAPDEAVIIAVNKNIENYFVRTTQKEFTAEERAQHIRDYFGQWDLPGVEYADVFVKYADQYDLDYRLLPSIAFLETTLCKYTIENRGKTKRPENCMGYGSGGFDSIEEGIAYVAESISGNNPRTAQYYAGKDLKGKMYSYNSVNPSYYSNIVKTMNGIYDQETFFMEMSKKIVQPNA